MTMTQWWADVEKWLETVNWGSAPDWFAAIGTVGTLAATIGIVVADRRRSRRADADAFSTWYIHRLRKLPKRKFEEVTLLVSAHNGGSRPVPVAVVKSPPNKPDYMDEFIQEEQKAITPIEVGQTISVEIPLPSGNTDRDDILVVFVDGRGKMWFRRLMSGRYVSKRKAARILGEKELLEAR